MPKRPKSIHPLRAVRHITGLSQPNFGKLVGVSAPSIQAIELFKLEISLRLAMAVGAATGVSEHSLMRPAKKTKAQWERQPGKPKDRSGKPYTTQSYEKWLKVTKNRLSLGMLDWFYARGAWRITAVIRAAIQRGKFWQVALSLNHWIETTRKEFNLESTSEKELKTISEGMNLKWEKWEGWEGVVEFIGEQNENEHI